MESEDRMIVVLIAVAVLAFGCGVIWSRTPRFAMRKTLRQIKALPERVHPSYPKKTR